MSVDHYTYRVSWSAEDGEHVGLCAEFPSPSWLAKLRSGPAGNADDIVSSSGDMLAVGEGYRYPCRPTTTPPCACHSPWGCNDIIIVLDALRKQRNLNDYEGDPISDAVVSECLAQAQALLAHTRKFLQTQFPDLLATSKKN